MGECLIIRAGGGTVTPASYSQVVAWANHYTTGNIYIAGDANLVAGNIRNGVSIFGVTGTFTGYVSGNLYIIQNGILQYGWYQFLESNINVGHDETMYGHNAPTISGNSCIFYSWINYNPRNSNQHWDRWQINFIYPTWSGTVTLYMVWTAIGLAGLAKSIRARRKIAGYADYTLTASSGISNLGKKTNTTQNWGLLELSAYNPSTTNTSMSWGYMAVKDVYLTLT